ncbi:MAG TPA: outer membrane beta-barrel protein [Mucilaginibacter sp.]|jgi:outer membrane protein X|nr:outer membrane beta-barrel protein [Mucilaginibacter sp.]
MKKLLLIAVFAVFSLTAGAKTMTPPASDSSSTKQLSKFHKFKVDLTFGYAIPPSNGDANVNVKAGVTFVLEPHYRVSDAVAVGLRFEGAGLGYADSNNGNSANVNVSVLYSFCPSVDFYLMNGGFRPFIGGGAGIYDQGSVTVNSGDLSSSSASQYVSLGSKFGFFPRAGFEAGHFRLSAEYNVVGKNANGNSLNYAAFNLGFFFGGGRR